MSNSPMMARGEEPKTLKPEHWIGGMQTATKGQRQDPFGNNNYFQERRYPFESESRSGIDKLGR